MTKPDKEKKSKKIFSLRKSKKVEPELESEQKAEVENKEQPLELIDATYDENEKISTIAKLTNQSSEKITETEQRLQQFLAQKKSEIQNDVNIADFVATSINNEEPSHWGTNGVIAEVFLTTNQGWAFTDVARENNNEHGSTVLSLQTISQIGQLETRFDSWDYDKNHVKVLIGCKQGDKISDFDRGKAVIACKLYEAVAILAADDSDLKLSNYLQKALYYFVSSVKNFSDDKLIQSKIIDYLNHYKEGLNTEDALANGADNSKKIKDITAIISMIDLLNKQLSLINAVQEKAKESGSPESKQQAKENKLFMNFDDTDMEDSYQEICEIIGDSKKLIRPRQVIKNLYSQKNPVRDKICDYLRDNPEMEQTLRIKMYSSKNKKDIEMSSGAAFLFSILIKNYSNSGQETILYDADRLPEIGKAIIGYIDELSKPENIKTVPSYETFNNYVEKAQNPDVEEKKEGVASVAVEGEKSKVGKPSAAPSNPRSFNISGRYVDFRNGLISKDELMQR